jgi:hypothetical protein
MPRTARWTRKGIKNGILTVKLSSWNYFHDFVRQEMLAYSHYVWRGQRSAEWNLATSLDRILVNYPQMTKGRIAREHLDRFKLAVRGRRGQHPTALREENDWWALAQHNGMATPLLDWTASPFVALYFAFEQATPGSSANRAVWAVGGFETRNAKIRASPIQQDPLPTLQLIRPMQDENARLVSQSGLFTRAPTGDTVDSWIERNYLANSENAPLVKIEIPGAHRDECLRTLNKMNISHLSLFPDIYGSAEYCNKSLTIDKY